MSTSKVPLESQEQKALCQWLTINKIEHFAVANENIFSFLDRATAIKIQARQKSLGAKKGVSDLVIFLPNKIMFLELKRKKNFKVSKEQEEFLTMANKYSYAIGVVCYGWEHARDIILKEMG